ncbi:Elongator subunit elp6 [Balamuthia mandrillaris]
MWEELSQALGWREGKPDPGSLADRRRNSCVLIEDSIRADGSFLLHHFLFGFLKAGHPACLLALDQSLFHYLSVGKKLGFNLKAAQDKGQFTFINGLTNPYAWTQPSSSSSSPSSPSSSAQQPTWQIGKKEEGLKPLYQQLKHYLLPSASLATEEAEEKEEEPFCLIIDNLNPLQNVYGTSQVVDFVRYLTAAAHSRRGSTCLVLLAHGDEGDEGGAESWLKHLEYESDIVVGVDGLPSGYSKDVHGQMYIVHGNVREQKPVQFFHYKTLDNVVRFTPLFFKPPSISNTMVRRLMVLRPLFFCTANATTKAPTATTTTTNNTTGMVIFHHNPSSSSSSSSSFCSSSSPGKSTDMSGSNNKEEPCANQGKVMTSFSSSSSHSTPTFTTAASSSGSSRRSTAKGKTFKGISVFSVPSFSIHTAFSWDCPWDRKEMTPSWLERERWSCKEWVRCWKGQEESNKLHLRVLAAMTCSTPAKLMTCSSANMVNSTFIAMLSVKFLCSMLPSPPPPSPAAVRREEMLVEKEMKGRAWLRLKVVLPNSSTTNSLSCSDARATTRPSSSTSFKVAN